MEFDSLIELLSDHGIAVSIAVLGVLVVGGLWLGGRIVTFRLRRQARLVRESMGKPSGPEALKDTLALTLAGTLRVEGQPCTAEGSPEELAVWTLDGNVGDRRRRLEAREAESISLIVGAVPVELRGGVHAVIGELETVATGPVAKWAQPLVVANGLRKPLLLSRILRDGTQVRARGVVRLSASAAYGMPPAWRMLPERSVGDQASIPLAFDGQPKVKPRRFSLRGPILGVATFAAVFIGVPFLAAESSIGRILGALSPVHRGPSLFGLWYERQPDRPTLSRTLGGIRSLERMAKRVGYERCFDHEYVKAGLIKQALRANRRCRGGKVPAAWSARLGRAGQFSDASKGSNATKLFHPLLHLFAGNTERATTELKVQMPVRDPVSKECLLRALTGDWATLQTERAAAASPACNLLYAATHDGTELAPAPGGFPWGPAWWLVQFREKCIDSASPHCGSIALRATVELVPRGQPAERLLVAPRSARLAAPPALMREVLAALSTLERPSRLIREFRGLLEEHLAVFDWITGEEEPATAALERAAKTWAELSADPAPEITLTERARADKHLERLRGIEAFFEWAAGRKRTAEGIANTPAHTALATWFAAGDRDHPQFNTALPSALRFAEQPPGQVCLPLPAYAAVYDALRAHPEAAPHGGCLPFSTTALYTLAWPRIVRDRERIRDEYEASLAEAPPVKADSIFDWYERRENSMLVGIRHRAIDARETLAAYRTALSKSESALPIWVAEHIEW